MTPALTTIIRPVLPGNIHRGGDRRRPHDILLTDGRLPQLAQAMGPTSKRQQMRPPQPSLRYQEPQKLLDRAHFASAQPAGDLNNSHSRPGHAV
jgi:hypothetical protein